MLKLHTPRDLLRETTHVQELAYAAIDRLRGSLNKRTLAIIDGPTLYGIWNSLGARSPRQLRGEILDRIESWRIGAPVGKRERIFRISNDYMRLVNEIRILTKRGWILKKDVESTVRKLATALHAQLGTKAPRFTMLLGIYPRDLLKGEIGITDFDKREIRLRIELTDGTLSLWRRKYTIAHELVHATYARYARNQATWFVEGMAVFYGLRALSEVDPVVVKLYQEDFLREMPFEYQEGCRRVEFLERICGPNLVRRFAHLRSSTIHDVVYAALLYLSGILSEDMIRTVVEWCESKPRAHERIAMMMALNTVQIRVLALLVSRHKAILFRRRLRSCVNSAAESLGMKKGEIRRAIMWLVKLKLIEWGD